MPSLEVTVILPTHNPDRGRLLATLRGLQAQTLPADRWETVVVDNASTDFPGPEDYAAAAPANLRVVAEERLGLTAARRAGIAAAGGALVVLVDDDNVLDPGYLAEAVALFAREAGLGAAGGRSVGEFERPPEPWLAEFYPLLALRDRGEEAELARWPEGGGAPRAYPACAPIGAGMVLRREATLTWTRTLEDSPARAGLDRTGAELVSGGDNDIVLTALENGWAVGYFPSLSLRHQIPASRLEPAYLGRLNRAIRKSWVRVLALHGANPWRPIPAWTLGLRQAKALVTCRAWSSAAAMIRWQGLCGQLEGQAVAGVPAPGGK
jgi:glycosyltransferase involved in cell wall biosynthesis